MFVPCINCSNLIHIEEIENHSNYCTKVREEVFVAENSQYTYHTIDYKLKKLQEHIIIIKNSDKPNYDSLLSVSHSSNYMISLGNNTIDLSKDMHYISSLLQYIITSITLSKIDHKTIIELKKILTNIDVSMHNIYILLFLLDFNSYL